MARIFRQTYTKPIPPGAEIRTRKGRRFARFKDGSGRVRTAPVSEDGTRVILDTAKWYIDYRDGNDNPRRVAGFTDKRATEQKAADLEKKADRERAGILDEQSVDRSRQLRLNIDEHVDAYDTHLQASGVSSWHLSETLRRLNVLLTDCDFARLQDIEAEPVQRWCNKKRAANMSARSRNTYTASLRAFVRWCIADGRVVSDPLVTLNKADESADVRRQRRALTEDELRRLLYVAGRRPLAEYGRESKPKPRSEVRGKRDTWTKIPLTLKTIDAAVQRAIHGLRRKPVRVAELRHLGRERNLIYRTLVLTGLRRGELAKLTWSDLTLDGPQAWLTVQAAVAKNRKAESLPIRKDLAEDLRAWQSECGDPSGTDCVFRVPKQLVLILDRDLLVAGIPKKDADGRTIDVHAMRHTTATYLAKAGVAPRTAQAIMRHSDIRLTLGIYTDPRLLDEASALDALPKMDASETEELCFTGTDEARLSSGLSSSLSERRSSGVRRQSSRGTKRPRSKRTKAR